MRTRDKVSSSTKEPVPRYLSFDKSHIAALLRGSIVGLPAPTQNGAEYNIRYNGKSFSSVLHFAAWLNCARGGRKKASKTLAGILADGVLEISFLAPINLPSVRCYSLRDLFNQCYDYPDVLRAISYSKAELECVMRDGYYQTDEEN